MKLLREHETKYIKEHSRTDSGYTHLEVAGSVYHVSGLKVLTATYCPGFIIDPDSANTTDLENNNGIFEWEF